MSATESLNFQAETRQLLNILIHSLYKEREIFLRELISNAADALTRMHFEQLTNRDVRDPDVGLEIRIYPDPDEKTLTIADTGVGMTRSELIQNLGTIAQSGAREFLEAARQVEGQEKALSELIGQFGVGFYSAFMVAERICVVSRSYKPDAEPNEWCSSGSETFTVQPAERERRGTSVIIHLKDESDEFTGEARIREVIRKHSDFIPYPIYIGDESEQVNRQTALWRQSPRSVEEQEYLDFYQQLTLDFEPPLAHAHMVVDAPVQMYALLFVPSSPERGLFSPRRETGLKLYARKVLIQEYNKDLLPEYLQFMEGVVDSEDLPLNVSRETVQANRLIATLRRLVTSKVLDTLREMATGEQEKYEEFWEKFGQYIKQGVAMEQQNPEELYELLRFHTTGEAEKWVSLQKYADGMPEGQEKIYYILGDDPRSVLHSPHLDVVRQLGYEALLMTDPLDSFMLVRLREFKGKQLENVATADLAAPAAEEGEEALPEAESTGLVERFKQVLGDRVEDVRTTSRLSGSPARLVDPEGALNQEMQRVYRILNRDFEAPRKVLEINPRHPILVRLSSLPSETELAKLVMEQLYEDALLIEGLHPDPAGMIRRIQGLMQAALGGVEPKPEDPE